MGKLVRQVASINGSIRTVRFALGASSLGDVLMAQSDRGVCAVLLGSAAPPLVQELQARFPAARLVESDFGDLGTRLLGVVDNAGASLDVPLDTGGTEFQQRVWRVIRDIPSGSTAGYSDMAKRIGAPRAVRAVAGACGANRLAILIPCHRIVRTDGSHSGYRWGIDRKRLLLQRETEKLPQHNLIHYPKPSAPQSPEIEAGG